MQIINELSAIKALPEGELRSLLEQRAAELAEYDDYTLDELAVYIVIEAGDTTGDLEGQLGFPGIAERMYEYIEEHVSWYEIVFIPSDDGFGYLVYVPKGSDAPAELLAVCQEGRSP